MLTYSFNNVDEILDFLFNTADFLNFEVSILNISTPNGISLNMNTKIIDPSNEREFATFKEIKNNLSNFIENAKVNNQLIDFNIKLKVPKNLHKIFDTNNDYYSFNLDFYAQTYLCKMLSSHLERFSDSGFKPIENFELYVNKLYKTWKQAYSLK